MEYLLGGSTSLLKEANTKNRSLLRLSPLDEQSLSRTVTCMCWSGGFGGYFEDELTVAYKDGTLRSYDFLTMEVKREYKLDSSCVYVTMLNFHFDLFTPEVYKRNKDSPVYPEAKRPAFYDTNDRLLLAVTESGYLYVFDWSVSKSEKVARVKHLGTSKEVKKNPDQNGESGGKNGEKPAAVKVEEYLGALAVYKYRGPVSDAKVHSLMRNRVVLAGVNNPPVLFDLFSESVLWFGKFPHETVLGLQSSLEVSSVCFLEELDDDVFCVSTRDSFVYVYDMRCQGDPVFEFNICDNRSFGLSKRLLLLPPEDYNSRHRRSLKNAVNENYSQRDRWILKVVTRPSFKLFLGESPPEEDVHKVSEEVSMKVFTLEKKDFCSVYLCDNFGTVYNLQFLTGVRLLHWIQRKIGAYSHQSNGTSGTHNDQGENEDGPLGGTEGPPEESGEARLKRQLEELRELSDKEKNKIVQHLLEARKRLCSSSNNDKRMHFRRNHYSQFVCRVLNCYNFHRGSVVDLKCTGEYLVSASLDRFSKVVSLRTNKLVFSLYCNQKQTCLLLRNRDLLQVFQDSAEFKSAEGSREPDDKSDGGEPEDSGDSEDADDFGADPDPDSHGSDFEEDPGDPDPSDLAAEPDSEDGSEDLEEEQAFEESGDDSADGSDYEVEG